MKQLSAVLLTVLLLSCRSASADVRRGTFSIVAYDPDTQEIGVAVQSKYFSVGTDVPWAEAGVGAIATQATVNPSYGPQGLALLRNGVSASQVLKILAAKDPQWESRQIGVIDRQGRSASHTGKKCLDWAGSKTGPHFACQGNILAGPAVVANMAKAFEASKGELAERLIAAIEAAQAAGGDKRGMQSAAVLVVRPSGDHPEFRTRYVNLKVEDSSDPIKEIRRLWEVQAGFKASNHMIYAQELEARAKREPKTARRLLTLARRERSRVGETLRRALARGEMNADVLNGLAWTCAINNSFLPDALAAAKRAVELTPSNVDIIDTLAEAHFRMGHRDEAIRTEETALKLAPDRQDLKEQLAKFRRR